LKKRSRLSLHGVAQDAADGKLRERLNREPWGYKKRERVIPLTTTSSEVIPMTNEARDVIPMVAPNIGEMGD
jgi:hypothetical protein